MKVFFKLTVALLFAVCLAQTAGAAVIDYTLDYIDNNRWQYNYTISNDTQYVIDMFDVYFDLDRYAALDITAYPNDWEAYLLVPSTQGAINTLALTAGTFLDPILPGNSLDGFSVAFDWFGGGTPGDQLFFLYDTSISWSDWQLTGNTYGGDMPPVPEPQTFMLLGTGIIGLAAYCRRNRKR